MLAHVVARVETRVRRLTLHMLHARPKRLPLLRFAIAHETGVVLTDPDAIMC